MSRLILYADDSGIMRQYALMEGTSYHFVRGSFWYSTRYNRVFSEIHIDTATEQLLGACMMIPTGRIWHNGMLLSKAPRGHVASESDFVLYWDGQQNKEVIGKVDIAYTHYLYVEGADHRLDHGDYETLWEIPI